MSLKWELAVWGRSAEHLGGFLKLHPGFVLEACTSSLIPSFRSFQQPEQLKACITNIGDENIYFVAYIQMTKRASVKLLLYGRCCRGYLDSVWLKAA